MMNLVQASRDRAWLVSASLLNVTFLPPLVLQAQPPAEQQIERLVVLENQLLALPLAVADLLKLAEPAAVLDDDLPALEQGVQDLWCLLLALQFSSARVRRSDIKRFKAEQSLLDASRVRGIDLRENFFSLRTVMWEEGTRQDDRPDGTASATGLQELRLMGGRRRRDQERWSSGAPRRSAWRPRWAWLWRRIDLAPARPGTAPQGDRQGGRGPPEDATHRRQPLLGDRPGRGSCQEARGKRRERQGLPRSRKRRGWPRRTWRPTGGWGDSAPQLLDDGDVVMTQCNAGALATVGYGTALGVVRAAREAGKCVKVIVNETRPALQGSAADGLRARPRRVPLHPDLRHGGRVHDEQREGGQGDRGRGQDHQGRLRLQQDWDVPGRGPGKQTRCPVLPGSAPVDLRHEQDPRPDRDRGEGRTTKSSGSRAGGSRPKGVVRGEPSVRQDASRAGHWPSSRTGLIGRPVEENLKSRNWLIASFCGTHLQCGPVSLVWIGHREPTQVRACLRYPP